MTLLSISSEVITITRWELTGIVVLALVVGTAIGVILALALVASTPGDDR